MADGLRLDTLEIRLGGRSMVALDAHVAPGEVLTVMGPSGSGKSTLLAAITGALDPAFALSGRILLDGEDVTSLPTERRRIGILFQDELLFPHLSVGGNLAFGLTPSLRGRAARRKRIDSALQEIGLEGFAARGLAGLAGLRPASTASGVFRCCPSLGLGLWWFAAGFFPCWASQPPSASASSEACSGS